VPKSKLLNYYIINILKNQEDKMAIFELFSKRQKTWNLINEVRNK